MDESLLFFKDKPIFGLDIGSGSVKVMQIMGSGKHYTIVGYGSAAFDTTAINNGAIVDYDLIAKTIFSLFNQNLAGDITTRRVVMSLPSIRSYNRNIRLPKLSPKEIKDAVTAEIEQYIPAAKEEIYTDYSVLDNNEEGIDVLIVAIPKRIVDSYLNLAKILDLEVVGMETSIASSSRIFTQADNSDVPTVLLDLGSLSSDLTIHDKGLVVTGTAPGGGDDFTHAISKALNVTMQEAHIIKTKYGLGPSKKQKIITESLAPILLKMAKEIKRIVRYYEERSNDERKIQQVVTMGGGANMPGLSDYLTDTLRIPVRMCDPWQNLTFSKLQPPHSAEKSMYVTAAGLALANPEELIK